MINHRDRLLILSQVDPDHRAITRQQSCSRSRRPFRRRSLRAVSLPFPQDVFLAAIGTPSPNHRTSRTLLYPRHPARQQPLARCPITTPCARFHKPSPRKRLLMARGERSAQQQGEITPVGQHHGAEHHRRVANGISGEPVANALPATPARSAGDPADLTRGRAPAGGALPHRRGGHGGPRYPSARVVGLFPAVSTPPGSC